MSSVAHGPFHIQLCILIDGRPVTAAAKLIPEVIFKYFGSGTVRGYCFSYFRSAGGLKAVRCWHLWSSEYLSKVGARYGEINSRSYLQIFRERYGAGTLLFTFPSQREASGWSDVDIWNPKSGIVIYDPSDRNLRSPSDRKLRSDVTIPYGSLWRSLHTVYQ